MILSVKTFQYIMSSYLEILMQNPPPENSMFKVSVEEEKVIVPEKENVRQEKNDFKKPTKAFKNKNPFRKKPDEDTRQPKKEFDSKQPKREFDPNYKEALKLAQDICLNFCTPTDEDSNIIGQSIKHVYNWEGYKKKIDLEEDNIKVELLDREYSFSKKKFLSNSFFQKMVREKYNDKFENTYLKFYETKDGDYKIHIKAGN